MLLSLTAVESLILNRYVLLLALRTGDRKANDHLFNCCCWKTLLCEIVKLHIDITCVLVASKVIIHKSGGGVSLKAGQNNKGQKNF